MRHTLVLAVILAAMPGYALAAEATADADAVTGVWLVQSGDARIEIAKAADGAYEGKIIWLQNPNYAADDPEAGKPVHDRENPDASKRDKPILGLKMLEGFSYVGKNVYKGGTIYDPETGKTYKCKMTLTDANTLDVRGFVGIAAFGRTETWTRYKEDQK